MGKSKSTKEIRAIDSWIKFQLDDGIESLTISGKDVLADVTVDNKSNVTLFLNADPDKVNEIQSLVPFINVSVKEDGTDPNKNKSISLSQDLTKFALELAEDSKQIAEIIKNETSLTIDFAQLITQLNELILIIEKAENKADEADTKATEAMTKAEIAQKTAGEHVYYLINNEKSNHRVTIEKYPDNEYDVTFENVWEGLGLTFNIENGEKTTKDVYLNKIITENFKNGCQIVRVTGATVEKKYENRDNFIRFIFTNVTSPVITLRIKMNNEVTLP